MKTETCINPEAVQDWELEAYADGEALSHVAAHLARCPACREQVAAHRALTCGLGERLYRFDCPSVNQLRDHHWDDLPAAEQADVAHHLESCVHCAAELADLAEAVATNRATPVAALLARARQVAEQARLVVAHLVTPLPQVMPVLRGAPREVLLFEAGEIALSLNLEQGDTGAYALFGQVLTPDVSDTQTSTVRLRGVDSEHPLTETPLDANGSFVLSDLEPGVYQLVVDVADAHIVVPELALR